MKVMPETPRGRGRHTKLIPETQDRIVAYVRAGAFDWVAAQAAGIHPATFFRWLEEGANSQGRRIYREFRNAVLQARAEARVAAEIEVRRADPLAWLLCGPGRERPGEAGWSRQSNVTLSSPPDGAPLKIIIEYVYEPATSEAALREVVDGTAGP